MEQSLSTLSSHSRFAGRPNSRASFNFDPIRNESDDVIATLGGPGEATGDEVPTLPPALPEEDEDEPLSREPATASK